MESMPILHELCSVSERRAEIRKTKYLTEYVVDGPWFGDIRYKHV